MKKLLLIVIAILFGFTQPSFAASKPLNVVASFSIIGDMVKNVGGDAVNVIVLVKAGQDAHTFQPTPDDVKTIAAADIVFFNGLHFEGWMERLIAASGTKGVSVILSNGIKPRSADDDHHGHNIDPHAWQNPANARIYVKNIAAALEKALPEDAKAINARAAKYDEEISKTDDYIKKVFAEIPAERKKIITSHDAFGYFGEAYGIKFLAPLNLSTETEASSQKLAKLEKQIKEEGIKLLFIENITDPRLIEQIAKDTGAKMGGTLYSDALSPADGDATTYIEMLHSNARKMRQAM